MLRNYFDMEKLIKQSAIWDLMERKEFGKPKPFSFQVAKMSGELATYDNAVLTSIHSKGKTFNVLLPGEVKPKTFRKILVTRFNEFKVYI